MKVAIFVVLVVFTADCRAQIFSQCERLFKPQAEREVCIEVWATRRVWADDQLIEAVQAALPEKINREKLEAEKQEAIKRKEEAMKSARERARITLSQASALNKAAAIELKLIAPGILLTDLLEMYPYIRCDREKPNILASCFYTNEIRYDDQHPELATIADQYAKRWSFSFAPGERLYSVLVTLESNYYAKVTEALIAKYGKQTLQTKSQYQNSFGAKFDGQNMFWEKNASILHVSQHFGSRDTMSVIFAYLPLGKEIEKFTAAQAAKASKDL
jgi:hypothetical protein